MADQAHDWTDEQIEALERRFQTTYSQAASEMRSKLDVYLKDFDEKNRVWQAEVRAGKATHEQYQGWLKSQSLRRDYLSDMCDTLAADASRTNQLAFDMINDELPRIYAENANYAAYSIESQLHSNTHAFDLVDQSTVRRMMGLDEKGQVIKEVTLDEDEVSPPLRTLRKVNVKKAKDVRWNRQKFNAALTQSILQGESIPNTAKRMARVLNMDKNMAVRAARTAMTSAENIGRVDSYHRAKGIGIDLEQEWLATLDERTRHSHRELDGQHVPVGEKFKVPSSGNELEFPADPTADPSEVWNCRCTLVAWFPEDGIESATNRFSRLPKDMTYDDWKAGKKIEKKRKDAAGVVDGKSLLGTWKRRDGEFGFEVEDVINAQGFDGLPRVVNATVFDEAAAESNFVAIRGYRAPSQEVLDDYRRQLYEGKWYVDCSSGGAYHGQGMYTFSTAGTKPTGRMLDGVKSFSGVSGVEFGTVETMTVDPSFRSIEEDDIAKRFQQESLNSIRQRYGDDVWKMTRWSMGVDIPDETYAEVSQRAYTQRPADVAAAMQEYVQASQLNGMDKGSAAALLGYDGIHVNVSPEVEYTVMLNRTKLIIRKP